MVRPGIGDTVHYIAYGTPRGEYPEGAHRAAIVTEQAGEGAEQAINVVGLCILNPEGLFFKRGVPQDQTGKRPGTWHWQEGSTEAEQEALGLS